MSGLTIRGVLARESFAGPVFVLKGEDGKKYELRGTIDAALVGRRVLVEGCEASAGFGFNMVGKVLEVHRITAV